jgi:hypothetical protein
VRGRCDLAHAIRNTATRERDSGAEFSLQSELGANGEYPLPGPSIARACSSVMRFPEALIATTDPRTLSGVAFPDGSTVHT